MPIYKVLAATVKKELPDAAKGPAKVIAVTLENARGQQTTAEWFTSATTPLPQPDTTVEGDVTPSDYGPKFKPTASRNGGFGRGGGGKSPEEQRSIAASVASDKALGRIEQAATLGLFKPATLAELDAKYDEYFEDLFNKITRKAKAA